MILDSFKLDGRVALVTGAGRGIGRALAQGLAEAGADIACVTRTGNSPETRALVESCGRRFLDVKVDLGKPKQRAGVVDHVVAELGGLDILVNNAGVTGRYPPEEYPESEWRNLWRSIFMRHLIWPFRRPSIWSQRVAARSSTLDR